VRGHVRKRGTKWTVVIDTGRDPVTQKRRQKWHSGFRTKREAEAELTDLLTRVKSGNYVDASRITLAEFLTDRWLPARRASLRPSTYESYAMNVRAHIVPALGSVPLQRLTAADLTSFYADLLDHGRRDGSGAGLSPRTVRYCHTILRRALADAERWDLITRNPADRAAVPAQRTPAMTTWTVAELRAFLHHARDDRLWPLWQLLAATGMRRGEVLGLTWRDLDAEAGRLVIARAWVTTVGREASLQPPKTARGRRQLALDRATVAALAAWRRQQVEERLLMGAAYADNDLIFCRADGLPYSPRYISEAFKMQAKAAGLPTIRLHDLRHTHASLMLQQGVHPKVVSERLGHGSTAFTMDTYAHTTPALHAEAAESVAALLAGSAQTAR
jgi:integrase